jgi:hypothetical protein
MSLINSQKYKTADPKTWLIFLNPWQDRIHPALAGRVAYVCFVKNLKGYISSGFRSQEEQIRAQKDALAEHPNYYQIADGRVFKPISGGNDQCMVSAAGQSSHNWGYAVDSFGTWLEKMSNTELKKYGLCKPMVYEPWHIEPIESLALERKKAEFYEYMGGYEMDVKTFQMITGLIPDNDPGPITKKKAAEVLEVVNYILNYQKPIQKPQVVYEKQGITDIMYVDPMALRFAKISKQAKNIPYDNFINGMQFGTKDGKVLTIGAGYSEGKKITGRLEWDNVARGTFIVHKDGRVTVEQLTDPDKKYNDIWFCVQNVGMNPIDLTAEWWPNSVGRTTNRIAIGYNPVSKKVVLVHRPESSPARIMQTLTNLGCVKEDGKVLGIILDSGTPATFKCNGTFYRNGGGLDNIIYV